MTAEWPVDPDAVGAPWFVFFSIVLATFVSEDLTCLTVGGLIAAGRIGWLTGLAGCFVGILAGDLGVWLVGRSAGRRALGWGWVKKRLPDDRLAALSAWLERHGARAAFVSRFLPGTRVPLYLAAGVVGQAGSRFVAWAVLAALLWTPAVVLSVAFLGESVVTPLLTTPWTGVVLAALPAAWLGGRTVRSLATPAGRARWSARLAKLRRYEFWPAAVFYLPLAPWFLLLSVRYRSFTVWTAANPGIPAGGVVGESKADILSRLPAGAIIPTVFVAPGAIGRRLRTVIDAMEERGWEFPLVLKPDAGQRGAGVKKVLDRVDVEKYLTLHTGPVIAQPFHPGPFEAGVFYYRLPEEPTGHLFSVTDKVFPVLTGDGRSTVAQLVWQHPRYRMQSAVFLARHAADADRVPADGEAFPLALAGNHCQGTLFRDGAHLVTPALERAVDEIARAFDGFFIGRFDVRYADEREFKAGRGFAIVELNGVTSEATNLYDPSWSLLRAYRTLFRQWSLLFRIGHANRRQGHRPVTLWGLFTLLFSYYRNRTVDPLAD